MLTFKDNPLIVDNQRGIIQVWNDHTNLYEDYTFEFISELYELIESEEKFEGVIYK